MRKKIINSLRLISALTVLNQYDPSGKEDDLSDTKEDDNKKGKKISYIKLQEKLSLLKEEGIENFKEILDDNLLGAYLYKDDNDSVGFMHSLFQQYLLAEYFLANILADKAHRLDIGIPTYETIQFIDGLVDVLVDVNSSDEKFRKLIFRNPDSVLKSFGFGGNNEKWDDFRNCVIRKLVGHLKKSEIVFHRRIKETELPWKELLIPYSRCNELFIHKWISLYFLNKLIPDSDHMPKDVQQGIRDIKAMLKDFLVIPPNTATPSYLKKLNNFDLSFTDLSYVNLSHFDLSYCNLSCANLFFSNISNAILRSATLSHANLHRSYITNSDLPEAKLIGTNLRLANLNRSRFCSRTVMPNEKPADLSNADLTGALLHCTEFRAAKLWRASLMGADLSEADLSGADLSEADLSGANLTGAKLEGANVNGAVLMRTNLCGLQPKSFCVIPWAKDAGALFPPNRRIRLRGKWPDVYVDEDGEDPLHLDDRTDLTGVWRANDGAIYCILHQVEDKILWWFGVSNANRFGNIFKADEIDREQGIISGEWADIPRGTEMNNGILVLRIRTERTDPDSNNRIFLQKKSQTGGFAGSVWKRIDEFGVGVYTDECINELQNVYSLPTVRRRFNDLSGVWRSKRSKDASFRYYVHQVDESTVWWFRVREKGRSASVFKGTIDEEDKKIIRGKCAELPRGDIADNALKDVEEMDLILSDSFAEARHMRIKNKEDRIEDILEKLFFSGT